LSISAEMSSRPRRSGQGTQFLALRSTGAGVSTLVAVSGKSRRTVAVHAVGSVHLSNILLRHTCNLGRVLHRAARCFCAPGPEASRQHPKNEVSSPRLVGTSLGEGARGHEAHGRWPAILASSERTRALVNSGIISRERFESLICVGGGQRFSKQRATCAARGSASCEP